MFERPRGGDRALLVALDFGDADPDERMAELDALAVSAGATVAGAVTGRRQRPDAATFAGKGKVEEIAARRVESDADLVIFNHPLTGAQQRNLERALECRVVDRTSLILDIFALRARSAEGKLQVELAQVKHQLTRLVGGWTHLERQKGGIGLRGPGETQLETDRRLLGERAKVLRERLSRVERQRATQGRTRRRAAVRTVALDRLYERRQVDAVQPADRRQGVRRQSAVRNARYDAAQDVRAGRRAARALRHRRLHPRAAARSRRRVSRDAQGSRGGRSGAPRDRRRRIRRATSRRPPSTRCCAEIGADRVPQIRVLNKIDAAGIEPGIARDESGILDTVRLSALTGAGCAELRAALAERFPADAALSDSRAAPVLDA